MFLPIKLATFFFLLSTDVFPYCILGDFYVFNSSNTGKLMIAPGLHLNIFSLQQQLKQIAIKTIR